MEMESSYVGAVVISGLVIVFIGLILLIVAVWIMGKIFDMINGAKQKKVVKAKPEAVVQTQPVKPAPAPVQVSSSDDDEVIAVIAAAVAMMSQESGKQLRISSIRPAGGKKTSRSNPWARAAASEATRSF